MVGHIFEKIKKVNEYKQEYWSARDLMAPLGYARWENFADAILRAKLSCENSKQKTEDHFRGARPGFGLDVPPVLVQDGFR